MKHGDHDSSCLCCVHFDISVGSAYSEQTPGDVDLYCAKGHFDACYVNIEIPHDKGLNCKDFKPRMEEA